MTATLTFRPHYPPRFDGTLILGESTFRGNDPCSLTGWGAYFDAGFPHNFILKHVEDNILNDDHTFRRLRESFTPVIPAEEFWAQKSFTNFMPELLENSHARPSLAQWTAGQREFGLLLDVVRHRRILVVGEKLWERLPQAENETRSNCVYRQDILAMCIPHPSWWNRAKPRPYSSIDAQRITAELMRHIRRIGVRHEY